MKELVTIKINNVDDFLQFKAGDILLIQDRIDKYTSDKYLIEHHQERLYLHVSSTKELVERVHSPSFSLTPSFRLNDLKTGEIGAWFLRVVEIKAPVTISIKHSCEDGSFVDEIIDPKHATVKHISEPHGGYQSTDKLDTSNPPTGGSVVPGPTVNCGLKPLLEGFTDLETDKNTCEPEKKKKWFNKETGRREIPDFKESNKNYRIAEFYDGTFCIQKRIIEPTYADRTWINLKPRYKQHVMAMKALTAKTIKTVSIL